MAELANAAQGTANHPSAIVACVGLAIAGFATFMGMPLLVGGVIDQYGFTEGQGGYLASSEYLGMLVASVAVSFLILRVSRRTLAIAGIFIAIASNAASILMTSPVTLLTMRFVSGIGCGSAYAVAVAVLAGSKNTARNFMFLIFGQVLTNALVVYAFPILVAQWHIASIFVAYCWLLAAASFCVPWLPRHFTQARTPQASVGSPPETLPGFVPWLCLFAVFSFYLMIGAYWAYIERLGIAVGFDEKFVGRAIASAILLSLFACVAAYFLSERIGQSKPLLLALAIVAVTHLGSGLLFGPASFIIGLAVVNCFWNFTDIFQLGTIANIDHSGVFASRVQGAQMLAMTISPAVAGTLLDRHFGYPALLILLGAYVAIAFCAYAIVYLVMRSHVPTLADAR